MPDPYVKNTGPCAIPGGHSISIEELVGADVHFENMYNHQSKFSNVAVHMRNPLPEHLYAWRVYDRNSRGGLKADASRSDTLWSQIRRGLVEPVLVDELKDDSDLPYDAYAIDLRDKDGVSTIEAVTYKGHMLVKMTEQVYRNEYLSRVAKTALELAPDAMAQKFSQSVREAGISPDQARLFYNDTGEENAKLKELD